MLISFVLIASCTASESQSTAGDDTSTPSSFTEGIAGEPGYQVVFRSDLNEQNTVDIYLSRNLDGENPIRITNSTAIESFPCVTRDGGWIYFISDQDSEQSRLGTTTDIYRIPIDRLTGEPDGDIERLTDNDSVEFGLSISHDAGTVVFMATSLNTPEYPSLYISNENLTETYMAVESVEHPDTPLLNSLPKVSGNSRYIVFNAMDVDKDMDIWIYDIAGAALSKLVDTEYPEYFPSISHDGSLIAFERIYSDDINDEEKMEILIIDRSGRNEVRLTDDEFSDSFPVISDNGEWILFTSKRWNFTGDGKFDEALYYMNVNDLEIFKFTRHLNFEEQADWSDLVIAD